MSRPQEDKRPVPADLVNVTQRLIELASAQQALGSARDRLPALDEKKIVSRVLALAHEDASIEEMEFALHYSVGFFTHGVSPSSDSERAKYREVFSDYPDLKKRTLDEWNSVSEDREWFRGALATITSRKRAALKALRAELPDAPIDVVVIPKMIWTGKSLNRVDKIASLSVRGMSVYVIMLLLDSSRDLGHALRRCKLTCCRRFFLGFTSASGGPRPSYCEPAHRILAAKLTGAERTARWRAKKGRKKRGKKS